MNKEEQVTKLIKAIFEDKSISSKECLDILGNIHFELELLIEALKAEQED